MFELFPCSLTASAREGYFCNWWSQHLYLLPTRFTVLNNFQNIWEPEQQVKSRLAKFKHLYTVPILTQNPRSCVRAGCLSAPSLIKCQRWHVPLWTSRGKGSMQICFKRASVSTVSFASHVQALQEQHFTEDAAPNKATACMHWYSYNFLLILFIAFSFCRCYQLFLFAYFWLSSCLFVFFHGTLAH